MPTTKKPSSSSATLSRDDKLLIASLRRDLTRMPPAANHQAPELWQLLVTLHAPPPEIWRRLLVPPDLTLAELHAVLQVAMGWTNSHLHGFTLDKTRYQASSEEDDSWGLTPPQDEREVHLADLQFGKKSRFSYEYDFGDSWEHLIVREAIVPAEPGARYPRLVAGARACPPEDVGGVSGFVNFLDAMADPEHPDHEEKFEWHGEAFDAERFDAEAVNRCLDALFQAPAKAKTPAKARPRSAG